MVTLSECIRQPEGKKCPNHYKYRHRWRNWLYKCYQIWEIYICLIPLVHNNAFDLFLFIKKVKVSRLWWNSNPICRATYYVYMISFGLISQKIRRTWKCPENFKKCKNAETSYLAKICRNIYVENLQRATNVPNWRIYIDFWGQEWQKNE